jgi:hypothetical protein
VNFLVAATVTTVLNYPSSVNSIVTQLLIMRTKSQVDLEARGEDRIYLINEATMLTEPQFYRSTNGVEAKIVRMRGSHILVTYVGHLLNVARAVL